MLRSGQDASPEIMDGACNPIRELQGGRPPCLKAPGGGRSTSALWFEASGQAHSSFGSSATGSVAAAPSAAVTAALTSSAALPRASHAPPRATQRSGGAPGKGARGEVRLPLYGRD